MCQNVKSYEENVCMYVIYLVYARSAPLLKIDFFNYLKLLLGFVCMIVSVLYLFSNTTEHVTLPWMRQGPFISSEKI